VRVGDVLRWRVALLGGGYRRPRYSRPVAGLGGGTEGGGLGRLVAEGLAEFVRGEDFDVRAEREECLEQRPSCRIRRALES
jgi:hypothetical protein